MVIKYSVEWTKKQLDVLSKEQLSEADKWQNTQECLEKHLYFGFFVMIITFNLSLELFQDF